METQEAFQSSSFRLSPFPNHTMNPHRLLSPPENPVNFLKVILSDDTQSTGIRIPKKFTEKHGKDLLERAILKVPNGDIWKLDLQKSKDEIWLEDGWSEFAERYGLKYGHLLMFKYEGFSIFSVVIFDTSASEIVYPLMEEDRLRNSTKEVAKKNPQEVAKLKTVKLEDEISAPSEDQSADEYSRKNEKHKRIAVERAKATYKSHKPFFVAYIQSSYITKKRGVRVPIEFRRKYWSSCLKNTRYLLKLPNDRRQTWEVLVNDDGCYLGLGEWMMFVKESGIKVGNICVFELVEENVLEVTIRRS